MKKNFMAPKRVKGKPGSKKREKCIIVFDDKEREEFLTGFHKRKVERRKAAVVEIKNKIKEEQKKVREGRQKEYMKMLKERNEALEEHELDELEDHITATTESVQYDHPNHTVTVTTISDLDLTGGGLLGLPSNQASGGQDEEKEEGEEREEAEDEKVTMPKKAFDPILNKKICSLTASLHAHSTKHKKKRKGTQEGRGRDQPPNGKSGAKDRKSGAKEKKSRQVGKTTKKQRRRQTGKRVHHKD